MPNYRQEDFRASTLSRVQSSSGASIATQSAARPAGNFQLQRPSDPAIIESWYEDVLVKKGFPRGSSAEADKMRNIDLELKWTLVHNYEFMEWQANKDQRGSGPAPPRAESRAASLINAPHTPSTSAASVYGVDPAQSNRSSRFSDKLGLKAPSSSANNEHRNSVASTLSFAPAAAPGSNKGMLEPDFYVARFVDGTITPKMVESLGVSLRTYSVECVPVATP